MLNGTGNWSGELSTSSPDENAIASFSNRYPTWFWIVHGLLALITIVGNGIVIFVLSARPYLLWQRSPNGRFLMSLAVADFCVGAFNAPARLVCIYVTTCTRETWSFITFFLKLFLNYSAANLCLLTLDRYIAIVHPFTHIKFSSDVVSLILIIFAWVLPTAAEIPDLMYIQYNQEIAVFEYNVIYTVLFTILPNVFMVYAYARILVIIRKHRTQIEAQESNFALESNSQNSSTTSETDKLERKRSKVNRNRDLAAVGIVVLVFLLCNLLFQYWLTCHYLIPTCKPSVIETTMVALTRNLNSAPNFFVYAVMKTDFRRELKNLFWC